MKTKQMAATDERTVNFKSRRRPRRAAHWLGLLSIALLTNLASPVQAGDFKETKATAERGNAQAQYDLGRMYAEGSGVSQSLAKAAQWYRKAAEQNLAAAQYQLGRLYANGDGVSLDYAEAMKWFRKAAVQGHALAKNRLGTMYEKGEGVAPDFVEAYKWFTLAAGTQQWVFAVANREVLARRMTAEQITEGELRVAASLVQK